MCARCWRLTPAQHSNLTSPHAAARIVMFSSFSVFRKQSRHALYGKRAAIARRAQIHLLITSCTDSRTSPKGVSPRSSGKIGGNCPTIFRKVFPVSNFVEIGKAVAPPWRLNQARLFANKILRPNGGGRGTYSLAEASDAVSGGYGPTRPSRRGEGQAPMLYLMITARSKYAQNAFAIRICFGVLQFGSNICGVPTRMHTHRARGAGRGMASPRRRAHALRGRQSARSRPHGSVQPTQRRRESLSFFKANEVLRRETGYYTCPLGADVAAAARIPPFPAPSALCRGCARAGRGGEGQ
jgi:hypothetical protein